MYSLPNLEPAHCSMSGTVVASWPAYRLLRRQVRWSAIPISWRIFHNLLWSTQSKPGFNSMWTVNFQMFKLVLEKAEEPEIKLPTSTGSSKKQESSRKTSVSAVLTIPKPSFAFFFRGLLHTEDLPYVGKLCNNGYPRLTPYLMVSFNILPSRGLLQCFCLCFLLE